MRMLIATVIVAGFALPALAQGPPLGKTIQVEFTDKLPRDGNSWVLHADFPVEQGDRFRIEMEPVGGADMNLGTGVYRDAGKGTFARHEHSGYGGKVDFTVAKGLTGKQVRIYLWSEQLGKVNVRVTKIGINSEAADEKDAKIKKLEDENASLKKDLAELKQQLADIKKLLEKK